MESGSKGHIFHRNRFVLPRFYNATSSTEPATIHLTFQETYPESAASLLPPALHLTLLNPENGLAFDHGEILGYAVKKLQNLLVEN